MTNKKILLWLFLISSGFSAIHAQKTVQPEEQLWFGVFNQTRFSNRWGFWADAHLRLKDHFTRDLSQAIIRIGPTYYVNDDVRLTAAYAYVHHFPAEGHEQIAQPEHRPWQQVQWFSKGKKVRLMQWVRLEERFRRKILNDSTLDNDFTFNWRARHNAALFIALTKKGFDPGSIQFLLNNELMINFGKNIVYNHFDQNRFFAGFVYQTGRNSQIHAGYMNLYQQLASGNTFRNQHTIRLYYFHNLDLRT